MYPRNAASPERIAVGAIYLIADGTIQTADAAVRVMPQGGAAGAGTGTLACDATSGIWHYTPAQSETNYTSFMVLVYKANCTSACATVVTTNSATPGTVDVVSLGGGTQSLTDLKDFADTGYDPATHKVAGVVLTDTCTTNTDMRGTDSAALASAWTSTRAGYVDKLNVTGTLAHSDAAATYKATGFSTHAAADVAALILATPAQKLVTDANGYVTYSNTAPLDAAGVRTAVGLATANLDAQLAAIVEDTGTTLPATLTLISGATFDTSTDSLEALRNRGDAAWITATGFSTFNPATDKVYLGNGAHGGAAATLVLSDYSDFVGAAGGGDATEAKQDTIIAAIAALAPGEPVNVSSEAIQIVSQ